MINSVIFEGHLTNTPELRSTPGGSQVCDFSLANNRKWTDGDGNKHDEVTYVDFTAWGATAESVCKYKQKGDPLSVEGRLRLDEWNDKKSGEKRRKLTVVAERVHFLPGGKGKDS